MQPDLSRIRWKLTGHYVLISGLVLFVFGSVVYLRVSEARSELLREQVKLLASTAASQMPLILHEVEEYRHTSPPNLQLEASQLGLLESSTASLESKRIVWLDAQRQELTSYGSFRADSRLLQPASRLQERQFLPIRGGLAYWRPVILRQPGSSERQLEGYVAVALSTAAADEELLRLRNGLLLGALLASAAAAVLSQWMVDSSLRPIRDQVQRLVRFTSDASHELRHPLTAIRAVVGSLQEAGGEALAPAALRRKLQLIEQAGAQMAALLDDLLLLTRLDRALPERQHWMRFDLCELIEDVVALHEERARQQQLHWRLSLQRPAPIHGHPGQLRQLLTNLIVNAFQFSPRGGELTLTLLVQGSQLLLSLDDQGPGIPPEQRALVFERFWQADRARSGANTGLGLAIARSISEAHGGSLTAQEAPGGGCRMLVQLPAAGPRSRGSALSGASDRDCLPGGAD